MRKFPSLKSLQSIHDADHALMRAIGKARKRSELLALSTDAAGYSARCLAYPLTRDVRMVALNQAARTYGVESVETRRGYIEYLNAGDTYATTLVRYPSGAFVVASIGDVIESWERRGLIKG